MQGCIMANGNTDSPSSMNSHMKSCEFLRAVFKAQLVNVEQIAAAVHGIEQGHDLAPLPVPRNAARTAAQRG